MLSVIFSWIIENSNRDSLRTYLGYLILFNRLQRFFIYAIWSSEGKSAICGGRSCLYLSSKLRIIQPLSSYLSTLFGTRLRSSFFEPSFFSTRNFWEKGDNSEKCCLYLYNYFFCFYRLGFCRLHIHAHFALQLGIERASRLRTNKFIDVACVVVVRATLFVLYLYCTYEARGTVLYLNSVREMVSTSSQSSRGTLQYGAAGSS
jgi:hypothetical protein